ncbi:MAG TPA: hypothetical protein VMD30_02970 [Tepidisphaeraceae bacterium]|nr:hypothetical protein [Tepidisphaeraceae bacterium]
MGTTITLDKSHFSRLAKRAQVVGKTPSQYVQKLIDADSRSFDQILRPIRKGFESMTDAELDDLLDRAGKAARRKK